MLLPIWSLSLWSCWSLFTFWIEKELRQKGNVHLRLRGTQDLVAQSMSLPIALYLRVGIWASSWSTLSLFYTPQRHTPFGPLGLLTELLLTSGKSMYVVEEVQETQLCLIPAQCTLGRFTYFSSLVPLLEQPGTGSDIARHISATGFSGSLQILAQESGSRQGSV